MTDMAETAGPAPDAVRSLAGSRSQYQEAAYLGRLRGRYAAEQRFKAYGMLAIGVAALMLVVLLTSIISKGYTAFWQGEVQLDIFFDPAVIDPSGGRNPQELQVANYSSLVRASLREMVPDVSGRSNLRSLYDIMSVGADFRLQQMVLADPSLIGTTQRVTLPLSDDADQFLKGAIACGTDFEARQQGVACTVPEESRRFNDVQIKAIDTLQARGQVDLAWNSTLFSAGDSREPELAGVWGGIVGSFYTLLVTLLLAVPIGVAAAVYLEEFAPKNRWTDLIEVNINNLAAVPSIVFGLLGLAVFLNVFGMPRSAPVVGGLVLALMTLPTVIIATRAALKAVPPSIREAALGIGASPLQVILHHVLPLAAPGMLTGTIIGMAHALGETAPLLMIGMVAFIVDIPSGFLDSATVLPVQIYMWADSPERAFVERTSAAIMVLLGVLIFMNGLAVYLRKRFERRW